MAACPGFTVACTTCAGPAQIPEYKSGAERRPALFTKPYLCERLKATEQPLESTGGLQMPSILQETSPNSGQPVTQTSWVCCSVASGAPEWQPTKLASLLGYCSMTPFCYSSSALKQSCWGRVGQQQQTALGSWDPLSDELVNSVWALLTLRGRNWPSYQLRGLCSTSCLDAIFRLQDDHTLPTQTSSEVLSQQACALPASS